VKGGTYRGIFTSLIDDPDYQRLSASARLILLTLRLCSQAGVAVIFRMYPAVLAEQTGLTVDEAEAALGELEKAPSAERPWIYREGGVVWVRNGLRHDPNVSVGYDKHRKAIVRAVAGLPRLGIVRKFCRYYGLGRPIDRVAKGSRNPIEGVALPRTTPENDSRLTTTENENESTTPERRPPLPSGQQARSREVDL
jgi:hypothetical protein